MASRKLPLDGVLTAQEPVHRTVEVVLIGLLDAEGLRNRRLVPPARRRELALRTDDPGCDHGQHQVTLSASLCRDDLRQSQHVHRLLHRLDIPVLR